jgi:putative metal-binding protein
VLAIALAACGHPHDGIEELSLSSTRGEEGAATTVDITDAGSDGSSDGANDSSSGGEGGCSGLPDNADFPWSIGSVDETSSYGDQASLAVDEAGNVHIVAATNEGLHYSSNQSGGWIVESIDPDYTQSAALAIAKGGVLHTVYHSSDGLRHATTETGSWTSEVIDPTGVVGESVPTAIIVDPDLHVHAVYFVGGVLRYATNAGGTFVSEDVSDTYSSYYDFEPGLGFARASDGTLHISFGSAQQILMHGERTPQGWAFEAIQGGEGTYTAGSGQLAIDDDDGLHVAFHLGIGGDGSNEVRYAKRPDGGDWEITPIAMYGGERPGLAVDADGAAHIVLARGGYATNTTGAWVSEEVALGGYGSSVALDGDRAIHVAWGGQSVIGYGHRVFPDGVDQNCDGVDGVDADQDGFASLMSGGEDCDDAAPHSYPGADDPPGDGIDQNCDGLGGGQ